MKKEDIQFNPIAATPTNGMNIMKTSEMHVFARSAENLHISRIYRVLS